MTKQIFFLSLFLESVIGLSLNSIGLRFPSISLGFSFSRFVNGVFVSEQREKSRGHIVLFILRMIKWQLIRMKENTSCQSNRLSHHHQQQQIIWIFSFEDDPFGWTDDDNHGRMNGSIDQETSPHPTFFQHNMIVPDAENLPSNDDHQEDNPTNKSFKRKAVSFSAMPFEKKVADGNIPNFSFAHQSSVVVVVFPSSMWLSSIYARRKWFS